MLREADPLTPELEASLARAMFPDPERIRRTLELYRTDPDRRVLACVIEGQPVSAAGLQGHGENVEVLHLGTAPGEKGRGHARALLHAVAGNLNAARLVAGTDEATVGFYRRVGFGVTSIEPCGERKR